MYSFKHTALSVLLSTLFLSAAQAAPLRLEDAAGQAVATNPEVLAKWRQFKAAGEEHNIAWGRYLPTLDVLFGTGHESRESPLYVPLGERRYDFHSNSVTLRQNLFEGFGTLNDTKRLDHATMVRFYEMLDISESAAAEAAKAYIDVVRWRELVKFDQESYATHRLIYEKIKDRASTGVGRKVDLETAAGRLALAESNMLTDTGNLHDVSARYQRIIGSLPPAEMEAPPEALLLQGMPADGGAALKTSFEKSPQLKAAFENVLSAMRNVEVQKAPYYPRIDLYAEQSHENNTGGYKGVTKATTVGATASWNLFNGWRDVSRERKAAEERDGAKDNREKVCRELRQNLLMAFNDHLRLTEQLQYLDQHQLSTDKEREAFRRQFDIGQRTLLDVLDIENEYFTARRNYLNGSYDLMVAHARYQAASGNLLNVLKLKALDMEPPRPAADPEAEALATCPVEAVMITPADKEDIYKRAAAKDELLRGQAAPAKAE